MKETRKFVDTKMEKKSDRLMFICVRLRVKKVVIYTKVLRSDLEYSRGGLVLLI